MACWQTSLPQKVSQSSCRATSSLALAEVERHSGVFDLLAEKAAVKCLTGEDGQVRDALHVMAASKHAQDTLG
eukprot:2245491-Amphidinium_carterae.1